MPKLAIPDVLDFFVEYGLKNPCWGPLHVVMDDYNLHPDDISWCWGAALGEEDLDALVLAEILLALSWTQRRKLAAKANAEVERRLAEESRVNGRDGYLVRRTSLLEGGDFVVEYADSTGEIHWGRFQSNELQFDD